MWLTLRRDKTTIRTDEEWSDSPTSLIRYLPFLRQTQNKVQGTVGASRVWDPIYTLSLEGAVGAHYSPTSWRGWFLARSAVMACASSRTYFHVCPLPSETKYKNGSVMEYNARRMVSEALWASFQMRMLRRREVHAFAKGAGGIGYKDEYLPPLGTVPSGHSLPVLLYPGLLSSCQQQVCPIPRARLTGCTKLFPHTQATWDLLLDALCQGLLNPRKGKGNSQYWMRAVSQVLWSHLILLSSEVGITFILWMKSWGSVVGSVMT